MISFAGPLVNDEVDQARGLRQISPMSVAIRPICLTFLLGLVACDGAPTPESACDNLEVCDWLGGSCLDTLTQLESDAAAAGCDEEMDAYLSCLVKVDTNVCEDPEYDAVFCPHDLGPLLTCMGEA